MVLSGVKAVFFDLDNTLIDTAGANERAVQEVISLLKNAYQYNEEEGQFLCERYHAKLLLESFDPSTVNIDDLRILHWEEAIEETRHSATCKNMAAECYYLWKSTRLQHLKLTEETRCLLTDLRKIAKLLLLTNGEKHVQWEKIEACACRSYFDAIVVGGEHREEKPSPSIFRYCCDLLGVQPQDCVMVGDNLDTDIQGGLNAGLKATIWVNKAAPVGRKENLVPLPDFTIHSVLDLPNILT
ncbi:N-acylneuraminate-9-phosphatase [Ambystoma mexicanum]|uniref:N-acylneuraminate-9-phosphatase n=1 Tax=Ambystoma mexicanum TaxID=8296 RepID=UPI0037E7286D